MTDTSSSIAPARAKGRAIPRLGAAARVTLAIVGFCALCAVALALPLVLPIGPMYWDSFIYYDGINRILDGQIPSVDFEAPVGALNYWLVTALYEIFPRAQPVLLIHFSFLILTAPLTVLMAREVAKSSPLAAWGLVLPFLFFAALPFDTVDFYPYPGVDGFGYYNRHASQLMYLTAAAVFFLPRRRLQSVLIGVLMLALFLSKITAFLTTGLVLAYGLAAGLVAPITALTVAAGFVAVLGIVEAMSGLVSGYLHSILFLVDANSGELLPRFLTTLSQRFDVAAFAGLLALAVLASQWKSRWPARTHLNTRVLSVRLQRWLDHDWLAIGVCLLAGIIFETQNTGSHAFLLVWPPILRMMLRMGTAKVAWRTAILMLVALATLPTLTKTAHRASRAAIVALTYPKLESANLGPLGSVSAKPLFLDRAQILHDVYVAEPAATNAIAARGELPSAILGSEPDFQLLWLMTVDKAVDAIRALETERGRRFETIFDLDFTNPFPFLMGRHGPRGVAIGADPFRTVPKMQDKAFADISGPGLVLYPTCPTLTSRQMLLATYAPALTGHERIKLTECFDAFVK